MFSLLHVHNGTCSRWTSGCVSEKLLSYPCINCPMEALNYLLVKSRWCLHIKPLPSSAVLNVRLLSCWRSTLQTYLAYVSGYSQQLRWECFSHGDGDVSEETRLNLPLPPVRSVCAVSQQQQLSAGVPRDSLRPRTDSGPRQHGEAAGRHPRPRGGAVLHRAQPAGNENSHRIRESAQKLLLYIFVRIFAATPLSPGLSFWNAADVRFVSTGDADQNFWHVCGSTHPGAEARLTDGEHLLVRKKNCFTSLKPFSKTRLVWTALFTDITNAFKWRFDCSEPIL